MNHILGLTTKLASLNRRVEGSNGTLSMKPLSYVQAKNHICESREKSSLITHHEATYSMKLYCREPAHN